MGQSDREGRMNLKELIAKGESETLEFKKSLSTDKLLGLNLIERKGKGKAVYYILKEK